jgi:phospholipase C
MRIRCVSLTWLLAGFAAGCGSSASSNDESDAGDAQGMTGDGFDGRTHDAPTDAKGSLDGPASEASHDGASDGAPNSGDAGSDADAGTPIVIPIHHVVVIVKENHTYDNMYGSFVPAPYVDSLGASHPQTASGLTTCPVAPSAPGIPATTGPCVEAPDKVSHDLSHAHDAALADWDNGKLDGWSTANGSDNTGGGTGDGTAYMQYFEKDIPNYWSLAKHYVLADHFHANVLGPSFPGHLFTVAAQAGWATDNPPTDLTGNVCKLLAGEAESPYWGCDEFAGGSCDLGITTEPGDTVDYLVGGRVPASTFPCFDIPAIPDILPSGITWKFYGTDWSELTNQSLNNALGSILSSVGSVVLRQEPWSMLDAVQHIRQNKTIWPDPFQNTDNMAIVGAPWDATNQVATDIANGTLPNVTWIVDQDEFSEHPNLDINGFISGLSFPLGGVCDGENWTVGYLNMLMQSPYWRDTAILITYDDFGGWYDHVPPPRQYGGTASAPYGLGFRLPLLIVSPWVKHGFVLHDVAEQASIAKFIETVFGSTHSLSDLDNAAQDGQASDLMNAFDFSQTPPTTPSPLSYRCCPGESSNPAGCVDNP